ncbi:hypothetical protein SDRG_17411 [Saprolegnia diclina VS20]|uniref:Uncharacterized protein n=1 Tax=Saprolegnia diclina (strain VS20) TaxID=1156394 RepID=T0R597_SAPDV|nr:hypothetical protein SDRG_17411 [Saprolegnia diclina VS20]EQC24697.1 hypothetical protein SDRG_17411 [Saprolegnia diclina VS20]|eukprot:XP_008621875.1 hypothetical protein SDRG_17411 [Saprolegnia diclina VS20]
MASLKFSVSILMWAEAWGGALYGWVFESFVHKLASEGQLKLRVLDYSSFMWFKVSATLTIDDSFKVVKGPTSKKGFATFPAIDAIVVTTKTIYFLQITISETHPTNWDHMDEILERVQDNGNIKHLTRAFVYVTPPTIAKYTNPRQHKELVMCSGAVLHIPATKGLRSLEN